MLHRPRQHIGDRLDPPMRMPGEPGHIIARPVAPEIVEQQERVFGQRVLPPESAVQMHACTLDMRAGTAGLDDRTDGHGSLLNCVGHNMGRSSPRAKAQMRGASVRRRTEAC